MIEKSNLWLRDQIYDWRIRSVIERSDLWLKNQICDWEIKSVIEESDLWLRDQACDWGTRPVIEGSGLDRGSDLGDKIQASGCGTAAHTVQGTRWFFWKGEIKKQKIAIEGGILSTPLLSEQFSFTWVSAFFCQSLPHHFSDTTDESMGLDSRPDWLIENRVGGRRERKAWHLSICFKTIVHSHVEELMK